MLDRLYHLLTIPDKKPSRCDFIIVFSYAAISKTELTPMTQAAVDLAVSVWEKHRKAKIIMSTGDNQGLGVPNSLVMVRYALSQGVPSKALLNESRSQNTFQNLKQSLLLIPTSKNSHIVLIAYDLHMRRVVATARKIGLRNFSWLSATSNVKPAYGYKGWLQTRNRFTIFAYDILAIIYSKFRGWI